MHNVARPNPKGAPSAARGLNGGDQRFFFWFLVLVDVNQRKIGRSIRDLVRLCYISAMLRIHYDRPRGDLPAQHTWLNQVLWLYGGLLRGIGSGSQYCSDRRAVCVTGVGMVTVQNPEHINDFYKGRIFK